MLILPHLKEGVLCKRHYSLAEVVLPRGNEKTPVKNQSDGSFLGYILFCFLKEIAVFFVAGTPFIPKGKNKCSKTRDQREKNR